MTKKRLISISVLIAGLLLTLTIVAVVTAQQPEPSLPPTIVTFYAETALTLPEVEAGESDMTLTWTVVGMREGDTLMLESLTWGEWLPLSGELDVATSTTFRTAHGAEFSPPTYRLVVRDANAEIADQWVLSVPYVLTDESPEIVTFESDVESIERADLQSGAFELPIRWEVANRTPTSNLIFEQILPDESIVSVEKPRFVRWIQSNAEGTVIPVDADAVTIRLSLVDLVNGDVLDTAEISLEVSAEAAAQPADDSGAPIINALTASVDYADYGDTVEVSWDVANATDIMLTVTPRDRITEELGGGLSETGTLSYTLPEDGIYNGVDFRLTVTDSEGQTEDQSVRVYMNCEVPWFFDQPTGALNCSLSPVAEVDAAYQSFERGMMVWRVDTNEIYVLGSDGRYEAFEDNWVQGEDYTSEEVPPEGLLAPVRGFGKVWAEQARVREDIGWATASETSYRMQLQPEAAVYKAYFLYVTLPDGDVIYLNMGTALAPVGTWAPLGG